MDVDAAIKRDAIVDDPRALRTQLLHHDDVQPIQGEITNGPFSNVYFRRILKTFGKTAFARSSACMEFESFLECIHAGGDTCIEIGTYQGITAVILSQFFKKVVCVSVDDDPRRIIKHDIVSDLGINNITFYDVKNNREKGALVASQRFDFAYVDGDHVHDTYTDFELVRRCGRVLFHEYWPLQPPVWNLVNSLPQNEIIRAQHDCFAYWKKSG